jgi:hypothetical protein
MFGSLQQGAPNIEPSAIREDAPLTLDEEQRAVDHLKEIIASRERVVMRRLDADDLPTASISISSKFLRSRLLDPVPSAGSYRFGHLNLNPEVVHSLTDQEIGHVIDHEMAHYVQVKRNKRVSSSEKLLHPGRYLEFKEGFATFASSLTNGGVERPIKESLKRAFSGMRPDPDLAIYVKGYLRFFAIAKATSADEALGSGLDHSLAEWRDASDEANRRLGLDDAGSLFWP